MFFKKKLLIYLYIFFIILNFNFIEFSTNNAVAKTFVISKVEVEEKYNINFNKLKVIDTGFKKAFKDLSKMILEEKDLYKITDTSINDIKKLVENFSILDEKFINKKYKSNMEVQFNKYKVINFFNTKNIIPSLPRKIDVFFLPVIIDIETNSLNYLNNNVFVKNWESIKQNYFQINYIFPNEDVEDYIAIKNNLTNIENYNFEDIIKKYDLENYIIMIIFKGNDYIKFYSKFKFDNKFVVLNKNFNNYDLKNNSNLNSMILDIKKNYEDNWKSINKMNPSASVPIRLSVESFNIEKSLKLEKALSNMDFVNNYKIEKFNNSIIVYKVNYSSNPKKFLKDIKAYNLNVDTTSSNWKIK